MAKYKILSGGRRRYGPYECEDGRKRVDIVYRSGKRRTVTLAKHRMEEHLGRKLDSKLETVDHVDRDHTNDRLSNLRVLPLKQHVSDDAVRLKKIKMVCAWCKTVFKRKPYDVSKKRAGPFCSRPCVGKYGAAVQNGKSSKLKRAPMKKTYYKKSKT